jgi:hypothetical protein
VTFFLAGYARRLLFGGNEMKQQVQLGTESGIVSPEAVKQIRMMITDLARSVQILDADIAAEKARPHADDLMSTRLLDTRRHNLMVTITSLEDRLESIKKMRSRGYARAAPPRSGRYM